jgi:hypothetical protein
VYNGGFQLPIVSACVRDLGKTISPIEDKIRFHKYYRAFLVPASEPNKATIIPAQNRQCSGLWPCTAQNSIVFSMCILNAVLRAVSIL